MTVATRGSRWTRPGAKTISRNHHSRTESHEPETGCDILFARARREAGFGAVAARLARNSPSPPRPTMFPAHFPGEADTTGAGSVRPLHPGAGGGGGGPEPTAAPEVAQPPAVVPPDTCRLVQASATAAPASVTRTELAIMTGYPVTPASPSPTELRTIRHIPIMDIGIV